MGVGWVLHHHRVWEGKFTTFSLSTSLRLPLGTTDLIERCLDLDVSFVASVRSKSYRLGFVEKLWLIVEGVVVKCMKEESSSVLGFRARRKSVRA